MMMLMQNLDFRWSQVLRGFSIHDRLLPLLKLFVRLGDGWFWLPVLVGICLSKGVADSVLIIQHCLVSLAISLSFYWPIKFSIRRARPFQKWPHLVHGVPPLDRFSFPSGHIMHNLAVGLTVAHYFPVAFWPMIGASVGFGILRVCFGVHFLGDVLAGGLLGGLSYALCNTIW
jgi:undecaprenyl-diphosphatase